MPGSRDGLRVLFVSGSGAGATLRYRVRLPEEALRTLGVRTAAVHFTDRRAAALAERADVVVLYRCPAGRELVDLVERLRRRPSPPLVTYDVDDLVFRRAHLDSMPFLDTLPADFRSTFEQDVELRGRMVPYADVVTASTRDVLDELALLTDAPGVLLPNGVGLVAAALAEQAWSQPRAPGGPRLGYFSGSATHDADWQAIERPVARLLADRPDVTLSIVGPVNVGPELAASGDRVRRLRAVDWTELPAVLRSVDVCLAPLARGPFADAKSAIKWLEAGLVGTATVATPTPPFVAAIDDGRTGLLASGDEAWHAAMLRLCDDGDLRARVGSAAREAALTGYGPDVQAERLLAAFDTKPAGAHGGVVPTSAAGSSTPLPRVWRAAPVLLAPYPWPVELRPRTLSVDGADRVAAAAPLALGWLAAERARSWRAARRTAWRLRQRVRGRPTERT